ncbi:unnamed protein product [Mytilus edulis]|uniref:Uncharacterized protein n=1 Tax=Mytilus edulis TaxID=6550 RepID=A0A8S3R3V9_MYTED|nr:unnamed protein product [Mytilus edulis]
MYTNMEFNELIHSVGRAYNSAVKEDYPIKLPSCETIKSLVATVLKNNYFEFNDRYFVQKICASMGSKCSPEICDIRAFEVINEIIEKYKYKNKILFYGRYRDDAFIIAHSSREETNARCLKDDGRIVEKKDYNDNEEQQEDNRESEDGESDSTESYDLNEEVGDENEDFIDDEDEDFIDDQEASSENENEDFSDDEDSDYSEEDTDD